MEVTKQEAKDIIVETYTHLAEHPEIRSKLELPESRVEELRQFKGHCPLCELFWTPGYGCTDCPLKEAGEMCKDKGSAFNLWVNSPDSEIRSQSAQKIADIAKEWDIG